MIDKFFYAFFSGIDKIFEKINKIVEDVYTFNFPNSKKNKRK